MSDTYQYDQLADVIVASTDTGILRKYTLNRYLFFQMLLVDKSKNKIFSTVVKQYVTGVRNNNFIIDFFDNSGDPNDLKIKVYVNNVRQKENIDYVIDRINKYAYVNFIENLEDDKKVVIEATSSATKNRRNHYKFPYKL